MANVSFQHPNIQKYFVLGILLILLMTLALFATPFLGTMLIAIIIVTAVYPLHRILHKKLRVPSSISAFISLILVGAILIAPLITLFFSVSNEAAGAYERVSEKINTITAEQEDTQFIPALFQKGIVKSIMTRVNEYAPITPTDVVSSAKDIIGKISSALLGQTTNILKNLSLFVIHFIVFLLSLFYFLRDGDKLIDYIGSLLPMSEKYQKELLKKLSYLSYGIIYGLFGAAIAQGLLVGFGLYLVGIKNALFWGAIAGLFSPLPYIGTAIVWVPVVITLLVTKHWVAGIFLLTWGSLVVGFADNLVKPYIIGTSSAMHPLAVLLVLLGGAFAFGLKGLLFGPFILTMTLAFLHIYSLEYHSILKKHQIPD